MERPKESMPPVGAMRPTLLILGSLPGEASLCALRYYAHPQNQFWRLLGDALGERLETLAYDERLARVTARDIALWDVVGTARRSGSLDAALRDVRVNPLAAYVADRPQLRGIGFNGKTAARIGRKALADCGLEMIDLPSSSAAYTAPFADKAMRWRVLAKFARTATLKA